MIWGSCWPASKMVAMRWWLAVGVVGVMGTAHAGTLHGHGNTIAPSQPQTVVEEPLSDPADLGLPSRWVEVVHGGDTRLAPQFGDRWNFRGVGGTRVRVVLEGGGLSAEDRLAVKKELRRRVQNELTVVGWDVVRDPLFPRRVPLRPAGPEEFVPHGQYGVTGQAYMIPRRPYLGETGAVPAYGVDLRQPLPGQEERLPDYNEVTLHLRATPYWDDLASLHAHLSFQRLGTEGPVATPGTVWQSRTYTGQSIGAPGLEAFWGLTTLALEDLRDAVLHAGANPQVLPDAAHLPGTHRRWLGREQTWTYPLEVGGHPGVLSPRRVEYDRLHGLDNHACGGAGRRWAPQDPAADPCLRYPQGN